MHGGVGNGKGRMGEECSMCGWWTAVIWSNEDDGGRKRCHACSLKNCTYSFVAFSTGSGGISTLF